MDFNKRIVARLNEIMDERKLSKYKLCQITQLNETTINFILNNKNDNVNFRTLLNIIAALEMTTFEFFDDKLFDYENTDLN